MGEKQSGFHIDVGILDNDACALEMISLLLRQRDAAIRIGWSDTNAQYTLERMVFGPLPDAVTVKVIVLDLALNGISGIDVCRQIRRNRCLSADKITRLKSWYSRCELVRA
ncbi:hypothetical protein [Bifidobacterium pseudocatenulatum]|uniref:hypothetical protein n=1 Tax=Bifidobacterium pseudocatenulatum TaxID=28026 RepID=UPI001F0D87DE|nr:hypothetical protein [Bifidobacterium pseudocatenulatum]MCH4857568.1 hypothetical protein [Bifidobacterium pseudocatenulatum]